MLPPFDGHLKFPLTWQGIFFQFNLPIIYRICNVIHNNCGGEPLGMPVNVAQNVEKAKEIYHDDSFLAKIEVLDSFLFNHFSEALIIDAEILQYLLRPAKGWFAKRHPSLSIEFIL